MKIRTVFFAVALGISGLVAAADSAAPVKAPATPAVSAASGAAGETISGANNATPRKKSEARGESGWTGMLMPIAIIVIMIFLFSRSNKKQQQKRMEMLDRIVKGTKVLLNSGVYGKVAEVREKEFLVEIAENVKVLVVKNGVASVEDEENRNGDGK